MKWNYLAAGQGSLLKSSAQALSTPVDTALALMYTHVWSASKYGKNHYNIVK